MVMCLADLAVFRKLKARAASVSPCEFAHNAFGKEFFKLAVDRGLPNGFAFFF